MAAAAPPKRAFTLIEILIVIGLIALLMALLMVSFLGIRNMMRQKACERSIQGLLLCSELLKGNALINRDHRLAESYWVDTRVNGSFDASAARRLSTMEYFAFLCITDPTTKPEKQFRMCPGAIAPSATAAKVEIWFRPAGGTDTLVNNNYRLSQAGTMDTDAWLPTVRDPWDKELVYRYFTTAAILAASKATPANPLAPAATGDVNSREEAVFGATLASPKVIYGIPAYAHPQFMSAGPDNDWGVLDDVSLIARNPLAFDNVYSCENAQ